MNVLIQLLFNNALSLYLNVHCTMYSVHQYIIHYGFLYNRFYIRLINKLYYKLILTYNKTIHSYFNVILNVYSNIIEIINFKIIRLS